MENIDFETVGRLRLMDKLSNEGVFKTKNQGEKKKWGYKEEKVELDWIYSDSE